MTTTTPPARRLRLGIIALTLATATVHLYLGFRGLPLFVLNGLGYLTLLAALYLPTPSSSRTGTPYGGSSSVTRPSRWSSGSS